VFDRQRYFDVNVGSERGHEHVGHVADTIESEETQRDLAHVDLVGLAEGIAAAGATIGLATGWIATSGMPRELAVATSRPVPPSIAPALLPVSGGITVGVGGALP
jgi:hypothetical protein